MRDTYVRLHRFVIGVLVLALTSIAVEGLSTSTALITQPGRKSAPDFALTDARGVRFKLSQYGGKVVLLDFWATWCTGCKLEIPWYIQFQNRYARQGLRSIGVAMDDEGWQTVKPYLTEHPISYPVFGRGSRGSEAVRDYEFTDDAPDRSTWTDRGCPCRSRGQKHLGTGDPRTTP